MTAMNIPAFFSYIFLTAFTPGPNNIMAMSISARAGLRRGIIFCVGVLFGFLIDMSLCAIFTSALFQYIPALTAVMKWVGASYILFLAIGIFRDKPAKNNAKQHLKPDGMIAGLIMQFVNIKVIMYGITALSSFVLPYSQSLTVIVIIVIILSLTGFLGACCWVIFGSLFQRFFEQHRKTMNTIMALLLVYCAVMSVQ